MEHQFIGEQKKYKPSNRYSDYDLTQLRKTQKKYKVKNICYNLFFGLILFIALLALVYLVSNKITFFSHESSEVILSTSNIVLQTNLGRLI